MEELFMQVFERRDWVKEQMRQQAVSYSQSLACAILAAGRRPPPWLIPTLDAVAAPGNTLRKTSLDLANLKNEDTQDSVHHVPPATYKRVEPKTLEFGGSKPDGLHVANCSGSIDQWQKCVSETVLNELIITHSLNEDQHSSSPAEVPHSVMSSLFQKDKLQPAEAILSEITHSVTSPLPEKEMTGVHETDSLTEMTCMTNQLCENDSSQSLEPVVLQRPDSASGPLPQKETTDAAETVCRVELIAIASPQVENDLLQPDFLEGPDSGLTPLPEKDALHTAETESIVGLISTASLQFQNDSLQPNLLEGSDSVSSPLSEKDAKHTAETGFLEGSYSVVNFLLEKDKLHSNEANFPEGQDSVSSSLLEKEPTHMSETDSLVEKKSTHTFETTVVEESYCLFIPQPEMDSFHQVEHTETLRKISFSDKRIDESSKISEHRSLECHVLSPPCDESSRQPVHLASTPCGAKKMWAMPQENMLADEHGYSLNPEENMFEDNHGHFLHSHLHDTFSVSSLTKSAATASIEKLLSKSNCDDDVYQSNTVSSGTTINHDDPSGCNGTEALVSAQNESAQLLSCERIEINCQSYYALYSSSSTMNTSSMDCQDDIIDKIETRGDISGNPQHPVCYICSSGSRECITLNSEGRSDTSNWKNPVSHEAHTCVNSSSQRSMSSLSDVIHCNSPRMKSSSCSSNSLSGDLATIPHYSSSSCSDTLSDGDGQYTRKTNFCLTYSGPDVKSLTVQDQVLIQMDYVSSGKAVLNPKNCPSSTSLTTFPSYPYLDQEGQHACNSNCSNIELGDKSIDGDPEGQLVSDVDIPLQNGDDCVDCNETVQQWQSCIISIPSTSPTIQERVLEAYRDSKKLVNLSSNLSAKYKMNSRMESLSGTYQSLAAKFAKLLHQSSSLTEVDPRSHYPSYDTTIQGISSNQEDNEIALTPSFEKYNLEKLSGRIGNTSECTGSIPALACFQIEENSSIAEENKNHDKLLGSLDGNYSSHHLAGRKPLECVTSLHKSKEKSAYMSRKYMDVGRLDLSTTKASNSEPDHQSHLIIDQAVKKPKENHAPSVRKETKMVQSLHDGESKGGILGNQTERHKREANLFKGWKPGNTVTSMTSFIPLVKQKQQPETACGKRDVRVKALEVAEAAKRREQKKQNEREMRKAAAALERERLKQEMEQKQKQAEQKKKTVADIVTRKRHREDDEKKEKERKKKCIEEPWKQKKQLGERMYAGNGGKDASWKDPDDAELRKNIVGVVKNQLLYDESSNMKAVVADGKSESSGHQIQQSLSDDADKPYEMSPYEDSDEDDDGDLEHKKEVRRKRKLIPSWTRKEILDKILLSNQTLHPREIFECKRSFSLSNVLAPRIPQRRLN
ncbi:hypothetical protein ABZP36_025527 [Zizania latifolia]